MQIKFFAVHFYAANSEETSQLSLISGCVCPGDTVTYLCSIFGGGNTVWNGSAFSCPSNSDSNNNQILLRHSGFGGQGSSRGICNDGAIVGVGISSEDSLFISQLNVTVIPDVVGKEIACYYENNLNEVLIGNETITLTSGSKYNVYFVRVNLNYA